jgi:hypothetical protein
MTDDSTDGRRGFLKSMLLAGSAIVLPNREKRIVTPAELVRPMEAAKPIDLDGYYLIPKSSVSSFHLKYDNELTFGERRGGEPMLIGTSPSLVRYSIDGVLLPGVTFKITDVGGGKNRQSLIAADGRELFSVG